MPQGNERMENIRLCKAGLFGDEVDEETYETKSVDISDAILYFLNSSCEIEDGLTLRDLFNLLERIDLYKALGPIVAQYSPERLKELILEGLSPQTTKEKPLSKIIIRKTVDWDESIEEYPDVFGLYDGDDQSYAIEFTPINELIDCKLELNKKYVINDFREETHNAWKALDDELKSKHSFEAFSATKEFTLNEILSGLFHELTFFGSSKEKADKANEIKARMDDALAHPENLIPWEDVKKRIEERLKK